MGAAAAVAEVESWAEPETRNASHCASIEALPLPTTTTTRKALRQTAAVETRAPLRGGEESEPKAEVGTAMKATKEEAEAEVLAALQPACARAFPSPSSGQRAAPEASKAAAPT